MTHSKIAIVTGASSGIGMATAIELAAQGYTVYAGARRTQPIDDLKNSSIHSIELDVTHDSSMEQCVERVLSKEKGIDVLVNNAGYGSYGSLEEVPIKEARKQFEVNVFGLARMTQLVLPSMRTAKHGKIVNISSVGGKFATPYGSWYHATKYAVEGMSDSLRNEVKQFGIDVIIIEPGGIKTAWSDIAMNGLEETSGNGPYKKLAHKVKKFYKNVNSGSPGPEVIAKLISKSLSDNDPKPRYRAGSGATGLAFIPFISDRLFDKILMSRINK